MVFPKKRRKVDLFVPYKEGDLKNPNTETRRFVSRVIDQFGRSVEHHNYDPDLKCYVFDGIDLGEVRSILEEYRGALEFKLSDSIDGTSVELL